MRVVFALVPLFLYGCNGADTSDEENDRAERLSLAKSANEHRRLHHTNFDRIFQDGAQLVRDSAARSADGKVKDINVECESLHTLFKVSDVRIIQMGKLHIPSGRIAVGDPHLSDGMVILTPAVKAGEYPVCVSNIGGNGSNAAVMIRFSEEKPVSWVPATRLNPSPNWLGPGGRHPDNNWLGDRGAFVCFLDEGVFSRIGVNRLRSILPDDRKLRSNIIIKPGSPENVIGITCGMGDQSYRIFYGLTETKKVACMVVDCCLEWEAEIYATVDDILASCGTYLGHPYFKKHWIQLKVICYPDKKSIRFQGTNLPQEIELYEGTSEQTIKTSETSDKDAMILTSPFEIKKGTRARMLFGETDPL